jgi:catechol 2,3-dioxygenase-like lactoylglutathione lyase family enzyme
MITHFADFRLHTVSLNGVRQFYNERLGFPVAFESDKEIRFQVARDTTLTFAEAYEPVAPAHFAFEVPYSAFSDVVAHMKKEAGIPLLRWPDGREIDEFDESGAGINVYFRDGDGHLLELIAHRYVREDVLPPCGPLKVMYLREVGFPVDDVSGLREWMSRKFGMKLSKVYDDFTFAIGGTAHAIVVSKQRRWIPIGMFSLPPRMTVTFGVSGRDTLARIRESMDGEHILSAGEDEVTIRRGDYPIRFAATDVPADIAARLNLP